MKQLSKLFLAVAMLFTFATSQAQQINTTPTALGLGTGIKEPLDSLYDFVAVPAGFGKHLHYNFDSLTVGLAVIGKDKNGAGAVCDSIAEDLTGKIVLIDRGAPAGAPAGTVCLLFDKCYRAWQKGAAAVIIVNNAATAPFSMGTADPRASKLNIPCMMISKALGDVLKIKINQNATKGGYIMGIFQPNDDVINAYPLTTGEYVQPQLQFGSGALGDTTVAKAASWFSYAPAKSGKLSVSSCGKGGNTSLFIHDKILINAAGTKLFGSVVAKSLDDCAKKTGDTKKEASDLPAIPVSAGKLTYVEWNDFASQDSFNFVVNFVKADSVNLTVKVDMKGLTVDPAGVYLAGSFQGWNPATTKCTNIAGTTIWTKTVRVKSDATYEYKFINGNAWGKDESVTGACAVAGGGNRKIDVKTEPIDLAAACFKSCDACVNPPLTCNPLALICDDFEKYAIGPLGKNKSPNWSVWDGDYAGAGPINITADNSTSGKQCFKIDGAITPGQDAILKTGKRTKGTYLLQWKMYVPTGKRAYYNVQHDTTYGTNGHVFANEVNFDINGSGRVNVGTAATQKFTYPKDAWFDVVQYINIDKDSTVLTVGTSKPITWKWSLGSPAAGAAKKELAGVDFYADTVATSRYYIDDVQLIDVPAPKQSVTFSVDMKNETVDAAGVYIAGDFQKAAGFPADWTPNATKLTKGTGTVYSVTVQVPAGDYQYKFINGDAWGKDESVKGLSCDAGGFGNRGVTVKDVAVTVPTVCFKKCYACDLVPVTFSLDLASEASVSKDGVSIAGSFQKAAGGAADWDPGKIFLTNVGTKKVYAVTIALPAGKYEYKFLNGKAWGTDESVKGACAAGGFGNRTLEVKLGPDVKLDTVCFKRCFACNKTAVNFVVDMSNEKTISADGISIAGNFQKAAGGAADWDPGKIFLTTAGKKIYTTSVVLPAGTYEYKYLNGKAWGTDESVKGACAVTGGNRTIKINVNAPEFSMDTTCFRYCVSCKIASSTNDAAFDKALSLYPNPAQNEVNLNYNFTQSLNMNVRVTNALGQVMYSVAMPSVDAGTTVLDIHNFPDGVYMIQVTDDKNRQSVKRLMIQR
jgi:Secretion system C-terminal sorting domain/PA domain